MMQLAWDREINISPFFCDVFFYENETSGLEQAAVVTMATRALRPFVTFLWILLECLTACKIWRGVENFHFLSCLILTDLFLTINTRIFVGPNVACHPVNNAIKSCEELWNKPETILEFYVLFRFIMDYTSVGYKIASLKRVM